MCLTAVLARRVQQQLVDPSVKRNLAVAYGSLTISGSIGERVEGERDGLVDR